MYVIKGRGSENDSTEVKWRMIQKGQSRKGKAGQEKRGTQKPRHDGVNIKRQENKHKEREKFIFLGSFANLHITTVATIYISKQVLDKPVVCLWRHYINYMSGADEEMHPTLFHSSSNFPSISV